MKDMRSMTPIVKKKTEKRKRDQCVIRKNGAMNTQ